MKTRQFEFGFWYAQLVKAYATKSLVAVELLRQAREEGMLPQDIETAKKLAYNEAQRRNANEQVVSKPCR